MDANQERRLTAFLALRQRYQWSVALFDQIRPTVERMAGAQPTTDEEARRFVPLCAFWFASLWVLVEGWRELGLSHHAVDPFLADPRVEILRRFRNYVYHFQTDYDSPKHDDLLEGEGATVIWVLQLATALNSALLPHHDRPDPRLLFGWVIRGDGRLDASVAP